MHLQQLETRIWIFTEDTSTYFTERLIMDMFEFYQSDFGFAWPRAQKYIGRQNVESSQLWVLSLQSVDSCRLRAVQTWLTSKSKGRPSRPGMERFWAEAT